jgi:hypothetical protein
MNSAILPFLFVLSPSSLLPWLLLLYLYLFDPQLLHASSHLVTLGQPYFVVVGYGMIFAVALAAAQ